ncbi:M20/M25/M40 family metallo-hydrolase [Leptobacterium flavescens]|uniref:Carboxypeptidase Q n=1 Tax=Leptobacterium flavescens TaxID=472055 RepID=A0A6P0UHC6_9FLAO|nr:M20/M25/M40 family metallo-hydrolase [Leptobacterium flavescens]NER12032.1 M20/M25/M40 family metallo-hydrolase [Leptobacterium flavescens]
MKTVKTIFTLLLLLTGTLSYAQSTPASVLASIRNEGFQRSQAMEMLSELTDVYGQRLTGSREYLEAAKWASDKMKELGFNKVHFENYCDDCRGWGIKAFNVEMTAPNYMHISAYPLAMAKSTNGVVEGEVIHIPSLRDMESVKKDFGGKLRGRVIILGGEPRQRDLTKPVSQRYEKEELQKLKNKLIPEVKQTPLPELFKSWETSDKYDQEFLQFVENEGALAVLKTRLTLPGILHPGGTYYYRENDYKPLPYFTIMPEHFGRLFRMLERDAKPKVRLNLDTEFYFEPQNNVNIISEITGTDPKLKSEVILIGGHFDSWHSGTGATDNAASAIVLMEALRILKENGLKLKRTVRIGLWGGEEQAFLGSAAYAREHYGELDKKPNASSKKVSVYLNLDNGAGAIRGIYLQGNEFARPVFKTILDPLSSLGTGAMTIENTLSTDHETFDHYNIPAFQFIQDPLTYNTVTHHTNLDVLEYVPEDDMKKNAVILAWTLYSLANRDEMVPRKQKN